MALSTRDAPKPEDPAKYQKRNVHCQRKAKLEKGKRASVYRREGKGD